MKLKLNMLIAFLLLLTVGLNAQKDGDPFKGELFGPEQIMENSEEIHITKDQRKAIRVEIRAAQSQLGDLQWDLQDKAEELQEEISTPTVDEDVSIGILTEMLDLEQKIKTAQMVLLIRMKNILTHEQIEVLKSIVETQKN